MTTKTTKLIRTIYLYVAALISLIFVAVGAGRIANTALKQFVFPEAEKGGYNKCNQQPPIYSAEVRAIDKNGSDATMNEEQKKQYEKWVEENSGEKCYKRERQMNYVDSFTMLLVALPICLIHWRIIKKDKEEKDKEE